MNPKSIKNSIVSKKPLSLDKVNLEQTYIVINSPEKEYQLFLNQIEKVTVKKVKKINLNYIVLLLAIILIDSYFLYNISKMIMILSVSLVTFILTVFLGYNFYGYRFIIYTNDTAYDFKILKKNVPEFKKMTKELNAKIYKFAVSQELVLNA
jgi:hypothetical protein